MVNKIDGAFVYKNRIPFAVSDKFWGGRKFYNHKGKLGGLYCHSYIGSLFKDTVSLKVDHYNKSGKKKEITVRVTRSAAEKFIRERDSTASKTKMSDAEIIGKLQKIFKDNAALPVDIFTKK